MIIKAQGKNIAIKHEGDVEPMVVPAQELLEVIELNFPEMVRELVEFRDKGK